VDRDWVQQILTEALLEQTVVRSLELSLPEWLELAA
jgi:hypothetical protein